MQTKNQVLEAEIFAQENADSIARVATLLQVATEALLEKVCRQAVSEVEFESLKAAAARGDLREVLRTIRPQASRMRAADPKDEYWEWIYGCGSYFDALGTRWPYLTQDDRSRGLVWAEEYAQIVCMN